MCISIVQNKCVIFVCDFHLPACVYIVEMTKKIEMIKYVVSYPKTIFENNNKRPKHFFPLKGSLWYLTDISSLIKSLLVNCF